MTKSFCLLFLHFFVLSAAMSQTAIRGRIIDKATGEPLEQAYINTITATGYTVTDLFVNYTKKKYECGIAIENLFNTRWKETQFNALSRLKDEPAPVEEIHFTPGVPFFARLKAAIFF